MNMVYRELILYGLDDLKNTINKVVADLNALDYYFDIKLILMESLTNAYYHGNSSNKNKPIYLRYFYDGIYATFEIEDSGSMEKDIDIPDSIYDDELLNDHGRGLFLIKCFVDKMELKGNKLIVKKKL